MYIGEIVVKGVIDHKVYVEVRAKNSTERMVIGEHDSIIALCDKEFNRGNSVPSITRYSYSEILENLTQEDEHDFYFDHELKDICGISIV